VKSSCRKYFYNRNLKSQKHIYNIMFQAEFISEEKKQMARNLYLSGISEEFIALQLDLETSDVRHILDDKCSRNMLR